MRQFFSVSLLSAAAFNMPLAFAQSSSATSIDHSQHNVKIVGNDHQPIFVQEYSEAMDKMHGPMMRGIEHQNPDAAFVLGMIPHHQGAIDMAEIQLKYGSDSEMKRLARNIIYAQKKEIKQLEAWLKKKNIEKQK